MTALSFKDILAKPIEEITAPAQLPMGTYAFRIKGHEFVESGKKKTPGVQFNVAPFSAGEDVDPALLTEAGGIADAQMRLTFWITEDSAYRLREFLENDVGLSGASLEAMIPQATNAAFKGYVKSSVNPETNKPYSEITKTMKAE